MTVEITQISQNAFLNYRSFRIPCEHFYQALGMDSEGNYCERYWEVINLFAEEEPEEERILFSEFFYECYPYDSEADCNTLNLLSCPWCSREDIILTGQTIKQMAEDYYERVEIDSEI